LNTRSSKSLAQKKRIRRKRVLRILIPILAIGIGAASYGGYLFTKASEVAANSKEELARGEQSEKREWAVNPLKDNVSILFMGVDDSQARDLGGATRTDALILATFNIEQKTIKMVSIPRYSYVYIPVEKKRDKITHAHVFGGTEVTIETVEELFDIPVDYYSKLNFEAFIDVVDALNGIKVDVPVTFTEQDSKDTADAIHLTEGLQKLNGEEALALARTRKIDNDIERGKLQQLVLRAIMDKAVSVGSITKYGDVMESMGDNVTTNLDFGEILSFFNYLKAGIQMESLALEGEDTTIDGRYYYQLDDTSVTDIAETLNDHLDTTSTIASNLE